MTQSLGRCVDCKSEAKCAKHRVCPEGCACGRHLKDWNDRQVSYEARHLRVRKARGRASAQICAECGNEAKEWAQIHETDGHDPLRHYQPMCFGCHRAYDGTTALMWEATRGRPAREATRQAVSASNRRRRGEKRAPLSEETRAKIAAAGRGRTPSPETREKIRASKLGKPRSPGTKEKLRQAALARAARRREEDAQGQSE